MKHWADGGPTVLENLASLCRFHHTLVHEGRYRLEVLPGGGFQFLDPGGRELSPAPSPTAVMGDPVAELGRRWLRPDVKVGPRTGMPSWEGEAFDYDWAIEDLQARAGIG